MDPFSQYKKQLEHYQYVENQRKNYVDLTVNKNNPNSSIIDFASILFNKKVDDLNHDLMGIILDESMEIADFFCMLVELVLYGLNILTNGNASIFDLEDPYSELVEILRSYLKSIGITMHIKEEFVDNEKTIYRKKNNYYCEIIPKSSVPSNHQGWYVLEYLLTCNPNFKYTQGTKLEAFNAFFVTNKNRLFIVNFKLMEIK